MIITDIFAEIGFVGTRKQAGIINEEFLPDLRGKKGIEVYKEMADNDDIIGAILFSIEMLMRQVSWSVLPASSSDADLAAADFVSSALHDMQHSWNDTLSEILSFLTYGWSFHEIVYKRRMGRTLNPLTHSKFNDSLIAWRKLPIRAQDTLHHWVYDKNDHLVAMAQQPPPHYPILTIPLNKALHFVTRSRKSDPQGRSILRNCYRSWYMKKRIQEIEGIGIERDLAGLPLLSPPDNINLWDNNDPIMRSQLAIATSLVQNIRRDALEGVVLPPGWSLSLLSSGGKRQFDTNTVIQRYDNRMAMTVMADFILLGHETVGSFALSSNKTALFSVALGTWLDIICDVFNSQAIPRLIDINSSAFPSISNYPSLSHGDIESPDFNELSNLISKLADSGVLTPDKPIEDFVRRLVGLPPCDT